RRKKLPRRRPQVRFPGRGSQLLDQSPIVVIVLFIPGTVALFIGCQRIGGFVASSKGTNPVFAHRLRAVFDFAGLDVIPVAFFVSHTTFIPDNPGAQIDYSHDVYTTQPRYSPDS